MGAAHSSDAVFIITDSPADSRFLYAQRFCRPLESSVLGRCNRIAKMAQFNRQTPRTPRTRQYYVPTLSCANCNQLHTRRIGRAQTNEDRNKPANKISIGFNVLKHRRPHDQPKAPVRQFFKMDPSLLPKMLNSNDGSQAGINTTVFNSMH